MRAPLLGPHLRELRQRRGLQIDVAADMAGLASHRLRALEAEQEEATLIEVWHLARAYGTTVDAIARAFDRSAAQAKNDGV